MSTATIAGGTTSTRTLLRVVLPVVAGVAGAFAVGSQGGVAPVIMVCGAIYLFAAVVARRWAAWVGFAGSFLAVAPGVIFDSVWISLIALAGIQVALVVIGFVRGTWRTRINRMQLLGAAVFSLFAVGAALEIAPWAAIAAVVGMLGHGAWDLWHHRLDAIVTRPYAIFCAVLDVVLAALIAVALIVGG